METIIDLTHQIDNGMPVYPEDLPVKLQRIKTFEQDGYNNHRVEIGMHAGTHIDGPMHLTDSTTCISQLPLNHFIGIGKVIPASNETTITYNEEYAKDIEKGNIVLFFTGHDKLFGKDTYYTEYPVLDERWAQFFIDKKVKMVGFDSPSPDKYPYTIHTMLLTNKIILIENLTNVSALCDCTGFEVFAFPLKIRADSSPVRVVARVFE